MIEVPCSVEGCKAQCVVVHPEPLCMKHYARKRRTGAATGTSIVYTEVPCTMCGKTAIISSLNRGVHLCASCRRQSDVDRSCRIQKKVYARAVAERDTAYFERKREYGRGVYQRHPDRRKAAATRAQQLNPESYRFSNRVYSALRRGLIARAEVCEECGHRPGEGSDGRSLIVAFPVPGRERHPVAVRWVCRRCSAVLRVGQLVHAKSDN
jgi:tRNA(Arg) A34 adenosine deaminase TadA